MILTRFPDCPEDVNRDGCVDLDDYVEIINHASYGSECPPNVICVWDLDGDYDIDGDDADIVAAAYCIDESFCCMNCSWFTAPTRAQAFSTLLATVIASNNSTEIKNDLISRLYAIFAQ